MYSLYYVKTEWDNFVECFSIQKGNFILSNFAWLDIKHDKHKLQEIKRHLRKSVGFCGATIKGSYWHGHTMRVYFDNNTYADTAHAWIMNKIQRMSKGSKIELASIDSQIEFNEKLESKS